MAATTLLKAVKDVDSRWASLLYRHFPFNQTRLADDVLLVVGFVACQSPTFWLETESKGSKGCKSRPLQYRSFETVRKSFNDHKGILASLISTYREWEKIAKRERPRWCKKNHLDHTVFTQVEDVIIKLKTEVGKMGRKRSLRSAQTSSDATVQNESDQQISTLTRFLLPIFPDGLYMKINRPSIYINMLTATTEYVFEGEEPKYILHLPNLSRGADKYFEGLSIGLIVEEGIAEELLRTNTKLLKAANRMKQTSPVNVTVPEMGDAVVLSLAGNFMAKSVLFEDLCNKCSCPEELTLVRLIEPDLPSNPGWKLEVTCPQMYQEKVAEYLASVVHTAMEELESKADLVPFPEKDSQLKLLVGSGGQVHELESNRHVVVLYLATKGDNSGNDVATDADDVTEDVVKKAFQQYGLVTRVRKSRCFPRSTLWGFIEFSHTTPARKACQMTKGDNVKGFRILNVTYMKGDGPLLDVTFNWRKPVSVRNKFQMQFTNERDLERIKNHKWPEGVHAEIGEDELKVVLTSEESFRNLIDMQTSLMYTDPVYPKFTTYSHQVIYEASPADLPKLEAESLRRIKETLPDGDLVEMSAEKPKEGAAVLTGKFKSYSFRTLERLEDILGVYNYNARLCEGEIHLERGVNMMFTIPEGAYKYLEPGLKKIQGDSVHFDDENPDEHLEVSAEEAQRVTRIETKNDWSTGFQVQIYREFYTGQDEKDVKSITKVLTPYCMRLTGDMMARLLAKDPGYILQVMTETDTYVRIMKRDCLLKIYGLDDKVAKVKNRIFSDMYPKETPPKRKRKRCSKPAEAPKPPVNLELECPICFAEISDKYYRLSLCGHVYCSSCLSQQVRVAMSGYEFPIRCGSWGCDRTILYQDILQVCRDAVVEETAFLKTSLQGFLRDNLPHVHPCITPDCQMVYHTATSGTAGKSTSVKCPLCSVNVCTSCHTPFHEGLSCSVYNALTSVESKVRRWMHEDEETRKLCPNCLTGIEKDGGCDHVTCTACKAEICWLCLQYFFDPQKLSYHNCVDNENW